MSLTHEQDVHTLLYVGSDGQLSAALETYLDSLASETRLLTVESVEAAAETAEQELLDGVVAVYDLPDGDGLFALSRCLDRQSGLVTVLVADAQDDTLIERAYEAGVDEFVHDAGPEIHHIVEHHLTAHFDGAHGDGEGDEGPPRSQHLETLAATTSDAIISVDESSVVRYANPAVEEVFGYEPSELLGEPLTTLMPATYRDPHRAGVDRYLSTDERTLEWDEIELPGLRADGTEIPLSISFSEFRVGDERYFTGVMRDIRERKRLMAERELYHDTTQRILKAESFEDGLSIALDAVGTAMDWAYGEAWIQQGETLERITEPYVTNEAVAAFGAATECVTFAREEGLVGRVWATGSAEWIADVTAEDAPFKRRVPEGEGMSAGDAGLGAVLAVPIVSGGTVVAVLVFFIEGSREADEAMITATTSIAADLGRLMERLEAETALRVERTLKDRILETSPVGIAILEQDGTFSYVNDRAADILGVTSFEGPIRYEHLDLELVSFEGQQVEAGSEPYRQVVESGASVTGELRIEVDGETRWLSVESAPMEDEDGEVVSAVFSLQDVTERKRRERRLDQHNVVMNTVGDGLYALDEEGRFVVVNDAYTRLLGYEREELVGRHSHEVIDTRSTEQAEDLQQQIHANGIEEATLETVLTTRSGEQVPIEATITLFEIEEGTYGRAGVVRDISDRKRREERLALLNEVGQSLTRAETPSAVAEIVVDGAREILDLPLTTVEYYDESSGELRPGPRTPELDALLGADPLFASEWDLSWQAYAESEEKVVHDLGESSYADETPLESIIALPLGAHGVFIAGATAPDAFTDTDVMVAQILVANTIAALDRVDREQELRTQKAQLQEHNTSLERINRLNTVIRSLTRRLTEASTRTGIEQAVCDELATANPYVFAWVGEQQAVGGQVIPRASAGRDDGYLDALSIDTDSEMDRGGPTATALRTREPAVQNNLHVDPPFEPWRTQALRRGYRASIAVPLVYRETVYGVLNLYAGEPGVFDEMEIAVLGELGSMVGYAINAIERKKALVSDSAVELTFSIGDQSVPAVGFAAETGGEFEFDTLIERSDGSLRVFFTVTGTDPSTVYEYGERFPTIEHVSLLTEGEQRSRYEAVVSADGFLGDLLAYGAHPTGMTADATGGEVTVELPQNGDVQSFVRMFVDTYEDSALLARTEHDHPVQTAAEFEATYRNSLTERQTEVLKTAYFAGFFEWPRETSGQELASMLDISQPTVSRHIRSGERKLFGLVFDDG